MFLGACEHVFEQGLRTTVAFYSPVLLGALIFAGCFMKVKDLGSLLEEDG